MRSIAGAVPLAGLWGLPLLLSLMALAPSLADRDAWVLLLQHPQLRPSLALSVFTGGVATALALAAALIMLAGLHGSALWRKLQGLSAAGLALPHLAFAIGFGFLIMPSGLVARIFVGGEMPPSWVTVQDPLGLSLIVALAVKEIPFLLTAALSILSRGDAEGRRQGKMRAAASLGHGRGSAWLRVLLPPLLRELRWPLVIVFVYGATVVDMALVLGPTQPPTFAVVIWTALNHASPGMNRMGLAGTLLLTISIGLVIAMVALALRVLRHRQHLMLTAGPSLLQAPSRTARIILAATTLTLLASMLILLLLSLSHRWPYPAILPPAFSGQAWAALATAAAPLWLSLGLGLSASLTAVVLAVLWFETQPPARDGWPTGLALVCLAVPQLAVAGGQYRLFLDTGLQGSIAGLFLGHLTPVAAYVLIVLQGPYRAFDARYMQVARALSASGSSAWLRVKLPLLKAPLLTSAAIGFAVSIMQFVPAQLIAAGRFSTLPMEAVTLASGGSRPLTAAFALALAVPPLLAFLAAAMLGRPRWR